MVRYNCSQVQPLPWEVASKDIRTSPGSTGHHRSPPQGSLSQVQTPLLPDCTYWSEWVQTFTPLQPHLWPGHPATIPPRLWRLGAVESFASWESENSQHILAPISEIFRTQILLLFHLMSNGDLVPATWPPSTHKPFLMQFLPPDSES